MYDMGVGRFLDVFPYVAYLFAGPLLAGRILRTFWTTGEQDWSLEFLYSWVFGVMVEAALWTAASATGLSPYLLFAAFVAVAVVALGRRRVEILSLPRFTRSDLLAIGASFLGLGFWIGYRFAHVPAVDEQLRAWGGFSDYQDILFHWAYAAEFKHFQFGDLPQVAGLPLTYVFTANLHMGLASYVSGASLELILLRGFPIAVGFVTSIGLHAMATRIAGRTLAGTLAVATFYFANSLSGIWQPDSEDFFGNVLRFVLPLSPSFLFSLPVFLCAFHAISSIATRSTDAPERRALWIVLAATLVYGALTKATFAAVIALGVLAAAAMAYRPFPAMARRLAYAGGLALGVFLLTYPVVSSSYDSTSVLRLAPLRFFSSMQAYKGVLEKWPGAGDAVWAWFWLWVPFASFAFMPVLASTLGQCAVQGRRYLRQQIHVLFAGMILAPLLFTWLLPRSAGTFYLQGYSVTLACVWFAVVCCQPSAEGRLSRHDVFWKVIHATCLVAASIAGIRAIQSAPVDFAYFVARYDEQPLVSADDVQALRFIARTAGPSDVVASNFHEAPFREATTVRYWYHSALAERAHFLEGVYWFGPGSYADYGGELARRRALLEQAFSGDRAVAAALKSRYGVHYLIDRRAWALAKGRASAAPPAEWEVFANNDSRVYRIP